MTVTAVDGGEPELELSDDPTDGQRLDVMDTAPVLITLNRSGHQLNYILLTFHNQGSV